MRFKTELIDAVGDVASACERNEKQGWVVVSLAGSRGNWLLLLRKEGPDGLLLNGAELPFGGSYEEQR